LQTALNKEQKVLLLESHLYMLSCGENVAMEELNVVWW